MMTQSMRHEKKQKHRKEKKINEPRIRKKEENKTWREIFEG